MLEPTPDLLHRLFLHNVAQVPLAAELYRYVRNNDVHDLVLRCGIARTNQGSVYLGIREIPTQHDAEGSSFAAVISWNAVTEDFTVRNRATNEESVANGVLPNVFRRVDLNMTKPPQVHLGYSVYFVEGVDDIRYCPALELAMIAKKNVAGREFEDIVRSVQRGEPDLRQFFAAPGSPVR